MGGRKYWSKISVLLTSRHFYCSKKETSVKTEVVTKTNCLWERGKYFYLCWNRFEVETSKKATFFFFLFSNYKIFFISWETQFLYLFFMLLYLFQWCIEELGYWLFHICYVLVNILFSIFMPSKSSGLPIENKEQGTREKAACFGKYFLKYGV